MKNLLIAFLFLLNSIAAQAQESADIKKQKFFKLPKEISATDYLPGVIIVKFKAANGTTSKTFSASRFNSLKSCSVVSLDRKFPQTKSSVNKTFKNGKADTIGLERVHELKVNPKASMEQVINELLLDTEIEYAEPSYIHHTSYIPNDALYPQQNYLNIIKAPQAWDIVKNTGGIIIGIVDSGSELTHEDLSANFYFNTAEIPNNNIDDDGDGFKDNYWGWDLVGATSSIQPDGDPTAKGGDHGIHVSGIAGARTDNAKGVASVSFNTAKLLIVKAGPDNSGTDILKGYEGIKYAVDHGAKIINCSWGSDAISSFGQDVVNYALTKDCLILAAAGNDGNNIPQYPAAFRGVLGIANTQNNDIKSSSSNFGSYVSLSAPGTGILSTVYTTDGKYAGKSGTSMSTPVVAGAAALVKAANPMLNMSQIGELLRATADNIDAKNPAYVGQLGNGRINVFRALTELPPSVRIQKISYSEKEGALSASADTVYLYFDLKNFLFGVTNLQVTLSTANTSVTVLTPTITINSLTTLETKTLVGPFKIAVPASVSANTEIDFKLSYAANGNTYKDFESFPILVARDFIDISTPSVTTSITSNGRIGFSVSPGKNGSGFSYKGSQLLYEASLMIGKSATMVSNNTRIADGQYDDHFVKRVRAHELVNTTDSVRVESEFDDSNSPLPLNIRVKHDMLAYKKSPEDKYVIAQYEVFNTSNTPLQNVHIGLFTDWDIEGGANNATEYNEVKRLGYVYDKKQTSAYAGVKLLSTNAPPHYYPLSFNLTGNPLSDEELTIAEKWETISSNINKTSLTTTNGIDVSFVSGNGPYSIPANGSVKIAFAVIGGDNLQDLETSADKAQARYDLMQSSQPELSEYTIINYPSVLLGGVGTSTVKFSLPEDSSVTLELYNTLGQRVGTVFKNQSYGKGVYERQFNLNDIGGPDIGSGIYFYRLSYSGGSTGSKVVILK